MKLTVLRYPHIDNSLSVYSGEKWLGHVFVFQHYFAAAPWDAEPRTFLTETMAILYLECAA